MLAFVKSCGHGVISKMYRVGVYHFKGGVGKTTSALNLAWLAAAAGNRTLLWDLDPQGASSWLLGVDGSGPALSDALSGALPTGELLQDTAHPKLHLIPADLRQRHSDIELANDELSRRKQRRQLRDLTTPFGEDHALLLFDCPPSLSLTMENAFMATDVLLVPLQPAPLSIRAFGQLLETLDRPRYAHLQVIPFFTMVDRRRRMHMELLRHPPANLPNLLRTSIPCSADIERCAHERAVLAQTQPNSPAALAYKRLWNELTRLLPGIRNKKRAYVF